MIFIQCRPNVEKARADATARAFLVQRRSWHGEGFPCLAGTILQAGHALL